MANRRPTPHHLWLVLLGVTLPLTLGGAGEPARKGPDPEVMERNRLLLQSYRNDPEHGVRLQQSLREFWALPPARRADLRRLDEALHGPEVADRARLVAVLTRYARWYALLSNEDRSRIDDAPEGERLAVVKEIRERLWVESLPRADQEKVQGLSGEKRSRRIAQLRRIELNQRRRWTTGVLRVRPLAPMDMGDLPREVREFVQEHLLPRLTPAERQRLQDAQQVRDGAPPRLARVLMDLSERYPVLPPLPAGPITTAEALPEEVRKRLRPRGMGAGLNGRLARAQGRWPDFALVVAAALDDPRNPLPPLGASRPEEFPPTTRKYLAEKLVPALSVQEKARLRKAEGTWPAFPLLVLELARAHRLVVPGMSLPGPPAFWEGPRARK